MQFIPELKPSESPSSILCTLKINRRTGSKLANTAFPRDACRLTPKPRVTSNLFASDLTRNGEWRRRLISCTPRQAYFQKLSVPDFYPLIALPTQATKLHADLATREQAEAVYRALLRTEPKHAEALHMLGALLSQVHGQDRFEESVRLIRSAISLKPASAKFRHSLGIVYQVRARGVGQVYVWSSRKRKPSIENIRNTFLLSGSHSRNNYISYLTNPNRQMRSTRKLSTPLKGPTKRIP